MKTFVAAFNTEFLPIMEAKKVMVKLESYMYFQKAQSPLMCTLMASKTSSRRQA